MKFKTGLLFIALSGVITDGLSKSRAEDGIRLLETSVKVLRTAAPAQPVAEMRVARRPVPVPTTPGAKYPQYQLSHPQNPNPNEAQTEDPPLRFFLNLPNETLLVEAKITIDQRPFPLARRQRVKQILKELTVGKDIPMPGELVAAKIGADSANQPASNRPGQKPVSNARETPLTLTLSPQGRGEGTLIDRLQHTMNLTGEKPTADEIDWMISNWVDGPTIMQLNDNFQRFRANQRPEFVILDRNRDGTISAEEMQLAVQSFQECDLNQDGLIQFTELAVAAIRTRTDAQYEPGNLITLVPDDATARVAYQRLSAARSSGKDGSVNSVPRFDANGNGQFEADEVQAMRQARVDLGLSISFDVANPENSRIAVTEVAAEFQQSLNHATIDSTGITLTLRGTPVIFSAVQGPAGDQISIGAVDDGYPLLPSLDPNDDGRLTVRELRGLISALTKFDTNHDGALTIDEARSPIRVCFGLGPIAHRELAGIRSIHRKATTGPTVGPEWFVRMDRNKDNDLTRGEFPGTDEQFRDLDTDADDLVSSEEAVEFDKKAERTHKVDDLPASKQAETQATDSTSNDETKP
jgi:Ca2+-binding EF-hand superfamily protein